MVGIVHSRFPSLLGSCAEIGALTSLQFPLLSLLSFSLSIVA